MLVCSDTLVCGDTLVWPGAWREPTLQAVAKCGKAGMSGRRGRVALAPCSCRR